MMQATDFRVRPCETLAKQRLKHLVAPLDKASRKAGCEMKLRIAIASMWCLLVISGVRSQGNADQEKAIAALKKVGASFISGPENPVAMVQLGFSKVTDADLANLKKMPKIQSLYLNNCKISDRGMVNLKGLKDLIFLELSNTNVTDAGLKNLKDLTQLQNLGLSNTKVSDAGLKNLKGLTSLKVLILTQTKVTDKGIKALQAAIPNLKASK
jgi:hypothetical protein